MRFCAGRVRRKNDWTGYLPLACYNGGRRPRCWIARFMSPKRHQAPLIEILPVLRRQRPWVDPFDSPAAGYRRLPQQVTRVVQYPTCMRQRADGCIPTRISPITAIDSNAAQVRFSVGSSGAWRASPVSLPTISAFVKPVCVTSVFDAPTRVVCCGDQSATRMVPVGRRRRSV